MKRSSIIASAVLLLTCMVSCTEKEEPAGGKSPQAEGGGKGNVTVNIIADKTRVLKNPLSGWVMYGSAKGDPSYWDNKYYVPELGKSVKALDYASACYIRTGWSKFNPADNVYVWNQPEAELYKMIKGAQERNMPIAFRVVVDGRDQGMNTPRFVFDAGAAVYLENEKYPDRIAAYPTDSVFRKYYEKFVKAFAQEFNDPEKTAFIDAYGLGKWGEGHDVIYEPGGKATEKTAEYANETMEWITSLYSKYFTKVPLVINYHRHIGYSVSEGRNPSPDTDKRMQIALDNGYCIRSDAFGMNNKSWGYGDWERKFAARANELKIPILMEGGWLVNSSSYWNDEAGYRQGHPEDVRKGEFEASMDARVNMMDFRIGDTESWFSNAYPYVQRFIEEGGYRLYPKVASVPVSASSGDEVQVSSTWINLGWGVCPVNLKQWNQKYKIAFALLDMQTGKPLKVYVNEESDLSAIVKNNPVEYRQTITLNGLSVGAYRWAAGIVDVTRTSPLGLPEVGLQLAVSKKMLTEDGWVILKDLRIQ